MAYAATGTAGNDTLNQSSDTGPGTIVGLAGDDTILTGSGLATVTGNSGNDTVLLRTGNTGTVNGGTENDSLFSPDAVGSLVLFGSDGANSISVALSTSAQTIVGGNNSNDGNDFIEPGGGADIVFGNGGNDIVRLGIGFNGGGNDTIVGGFGTDSVSVFNNGGDGAQFYFGNEGADTIATQGGNDTAFLGLGNDSYHQFAGGAAAAPIIFGNEGADTLSLQVANADVAASTIVGGNDSADGANSVLGAPSPDLIFGNGGADTVNASGGANTVVGGFGNDCIAATTGNDLVFGNENNDTIDVGAGANTVFGGLGNDSILGGAGRETFQGNENNDTIRGDLLGGISIDTIAGGSGNDVFAYTDAGADGNNAVGGGPLEQITDLDWSVDRFQTTGLVSFATNTGAGTGADLNASANNAIAAAFALNGGALVNVAAQFTFGGRTYLAMSLDANNTFTDLTDLLIDITGVTGAIATSNFV